LMKIGGNCWFATSNTASDTNNLHSANIMLNPKYDD